MEDIKFTEEQVILLNQYFSRKGLNIKCGTGHKVEFKCGNATEVFEVVELDRDHCVLKSQVSSKVMYLFSNKPTFLALENKLVVLSFEWLNKGKIYIFVKADRAVKVKYYGKS